MSKLKSLNIKMPSLYYFLSIILRDVLLRAKISDKLAYFAFFILLLSGVIWKSITICELINVAILAPFHGFAFGSFAFILVLLLFTGIELLIRRNKIFIYSLQSKSSKNNFLIWQIVFQTIFVGLLLFLVNLFSKYDFILGAFGTSFALILLTNFVRGLFPIVQPKPVNNNSSSGYRNRFYIIFPEGNFLKSSFYFWRKNIFTPSNLVNIIFLIIGAILTSIYVENAIPVIGFISVIILILQLSNYDFELKKLARDLTLNVSHSKIFFKDTIALITPYIFLFICNAFCLLFMAEHDFIYINFVIILASVWFVWIWQNALNIRGKRMAWVVMAQAIIFNLVLLFAFVPAGILSMFFWVWHVFNQQKKLIFKGNN